MVNTNNQKAAVKPTNIKLVSENGRTRIYATSTIEPKVSFTPRVRITTA